MKMQFTTADGSKWLMDQSWVDEQLAEFQQTQEVVLGDVQVTPDAFHDYLLDESIGDHHDRDYSRWLYPNAKLIDPSGDAQHLFDLGAFEFEEDDTEKNAYANGWKLGDIEITE